MVTRKTLLKRLEHINLATWIPLNDIDEIIGSCEHELRFRKPGPSYAATSGKIFDALYLTITQLWGVPSTKFSLEKVFEIALQTGREFISMDKPCWLDTMTSLMLIASLRADDTELTSFSNWFKVEKYSLGDLPEISYQPILYQVADIFRRKKFRSFEKLNKYNETWRIKPPQMLMSAVEGIRKMESKTTFDNLLAAALDHAKRSNIRLSKGSRMPPLEIVAMYPSLLWNVAELRGLQPPSIPPEIRPFMLTRQTLGLPPIQAVKTSGESKPVVPKTVKAKLAKGKAVNGKTAKAKSVKAKTAKAKTAKAKTAKVKSAKVKSAKVKRTKTSKAVKAKDRKA